MFFNCLWFFSTSLNSQHKVKFFSFSSSQEIFVPSQNQKLFCYVNKLMDKCYCSHKPMNSPRIVFLSSLFFYFMAVISLAQWIALFIISSVSQLSPGESSTSQFLETGQHVSCATLLILATYLILWGPVLQTKMWLF